MCCAPMQIIMAEDESRGRGRSRGGRRGGAALRTTAAPSVTSVGAAAPEVAPVVSKPMAAPSFESAEFRKWLTKVRGVFLHPCAVVHQHPTDPSKGLGVFSVREGITEGATVVSCPHSGYWSPADADVADSPVVELIANERASLLAAWRSSLDAVPIVFLMPTARMKSPTPGLTKVALRWMAESRAPASDRSRWWPWVAMEPLSSCLFDCRKPLTDTPSSWCPAVAEELLDLDLGRIFDTVVMPFVLRHPQVYRLTDTTGATERDELWRSFVNALSLIMSRNFHVEQRKDDDGPFLCPGIDFINHNRESSGKVNVRLVLRGGGGKKAVSFDVQATRPIRAGEEVVFDYGPLSLARFAVEFQFIPDCGSAGASVRFSQRQLVQWAAAWHAAEGSPCDEGEAARRMKHLDDIGIVNFEGLLDLTDAPPSSAPATVTVSVQLWNTVALLCLPQAAYDSLKTSLARWWEAPRTDARLQKAMAQLLTARLARVKEGSALIAAWEPEAASQQWKGMLAAVNDDEAKRLTAALSQLPSI